MSIQIHETNTTLCLLGGFSSFSHLLPSRVRPKHAATRRNLIIMAAASPSAAGIDGSAAVGLAPAAASPAAAIATATPAIVVPAAPINGEKGPVAPVSSNSSDKSGVPRNS